MNTNKYRFAHTKEYTVVETRKEFWWSYDELKTVYNTLREEITEVIIKIEEKGDQLDISKVYIVTSTEDFNRFLKEEDEEWKELTT